MHRIVDNLLDQEYFDQIKNVILGHEFPWYFNDFITYPDEGGDKFYYTHTFYDNFESNSPFFDLVRGVLNVLECNSILRVRASSYSQSDKPIINKPHRDYNFSHKGCLLYLNENNGLTHFKDGSVKPEENRAALFDPSIEHSSSHCTDKKRRVIININYF